MSFAVNDAGLFDDDRRLDFVVHLSAGFQRVLVDGRFHAFGRGGTMKLAQNFAHVAAVRNDSEAVLDGNPGDLAGVFLFDWIDDIFYKLEVGGAGRTDAVDDGAGGAFGSGKKIRYQLIIGL